MNIVAQAFFDVFKPDPIITVSQWSDDNRILPSVAAAEPGRWRTSRTPYLRAIMDDLSPSSPVEELCFMKGAQIGASESGSNWVGFVMDAAPGPMLLVQPTVDIAKRFSQQRITPLITETPCLRGKVADSRSRDSANTQMMKEFPGGMLLLAGANSAAALRSMPIRYLFLDEVDAYPADIEGEGSPIELAVARTRTFARRKIYKVSTPTIKGISKIEDEFERSDQRRYFVPCPHCSNMDTIRWENIVFESDKTGRPLPETTFLKCAECGGIIKEHHKTDMLNRGEWRVTKPENEHRKRRGYHLSALYSPVGWFSWADAVQMFANAAGHPNKLKTFYNTVLGETWNQSGESVEPHDLQSRAEDYTPDLLPDGVLLLTAGVDVQPDRLEVEIVGWGVGEESWSIDYQIIRGDPEGALVWNQLDLLLTKTYAHPIGIELQAVMTFIDSGGHNTVAVYDYVRPRSGMGIYAIKGQGGDGKAPVGNPTRNNIGKIPLVPLGVNSIKDMIYGRLKISEPGRGYCHFPKRYPKEYYEQLTAEEIRVRYDKKGFPIAEWHKKPNRIRNEALDVRVYATAAMLQGHFNFDQIAELFANHEASKQNGSQAGERRVRGGMIGES